MPHVIRASINYTYANIILIIKKLGGLGVKWKRERREKKKKKKKPGQGRAERGWEIIIAATIKRKPGRTHTCSGGVCSNSGGF